MPHHWVFGAVAFVVVTIALLLWVLLTRAICKSQRSREMSLTAALAVFSVLYTLVIAELLVSLFVVETHAVGQVTLAAQRWDERYWRPTINSLGYRDHEPVWSDHLLVIVGASFVAGGGIENLDDRMSGVLAAKLGKGWTVATITPGLDTRKQFEALSAYPKVPDVIIVSHTPIDIVAAAERRRGSVAQIGLRPPPPSIRPLIDHSSLANLVYWKYFNQNEYSAYWAYIEGAYAEPDIFADHLEDLKKFKAYSRKTGARLYYLIWPLLAFARAAEPINTQVSAALSAIGADVIDLTPRLADRPVADMVVNASDPHPNKQVHAEVGNLLFDRLQKDGINALPMAVNEAGSSGTH